MTPPPVTDETKARRKTLEEISAPIFDAAMGLRLAYMRMHHKWNQKELGERLGVLQATISDLEIGRLNVPRHPFTVAKLIEVLGKNDAHYVLFDTGAHRYHFGIIRSKYYQTKYRDERKPREPGEHWTARRKRQGLPVRGSYQNQFLIQTKPVKRKGSKGES